jgi:starch phosphorylase
MSILNVARIAKFSSDRAIREYCQDIWHTKPVPIELEAAEEPEEVGLRLVQSRP